MRRFARPATFAPVLAFALLTAACAADPENASSGPAPTATPTAAPTSTPSALPSGGYVTARRIAKGTEVHASLLSELWTGWDGPGETPATFYETFPADLCFEIPSEPEEPTFYDFVDLGGAMTLSGPNAITLARTVMFSQVWYEANVTPADLAPGGSWTLALPDGRSFDGAFRMPRASQVNTPAIAGGVVTFSKNEPLEVSFAPFDADFVFLLFIGGNGRGRVCRLTDDGSFTVPALTVGALPSYGTIALVAMSRTIVDLDGRGVEVTGSVETVADYEKL